MTEVNAAALAIHPFLHGMPADQLSVLAEAARDVSFPARYRLFEDGGNATRFWLIQSGLVVGSRGHGSFADALLGSVGQYCVHHAHCPVPIMRDEPHHAAA